MRRKTMKNKTLITFSVLSFLGISAFYPFLPDTIPIHWNASGEIDNWGGKWNIFWLAALPLINVILFKLLPKIDPKKENYEKHQKAYGWVQWIIAIVFIGLGWLILSFSMGVEFDMGVVLRLVLGIMFILLGNFMGQLRQNYFVGIKTPWTLADENVWRKTHRRGAVVFALMGLAMISSILLPVKYLATIVLTTSIGGVAYLFLYSYLEFRKLSPK
jgi:uncharacterized membrane protein